MNVFTVIVVLSCVVVALALTEYDEQMIKTNREECINSSKVSPEVEARSEKGDIDKDDPKLAEFWLCVYKKLDFLNDTWDYQADVMRKSMEKNSKLNEKIVEEIMDNCTKTKYDTGEEAAMALLICYFKFAPKE